MSINPSQPKLIEVPGIPGKLREQTLDEYMGALSPDHLARQQLQEIRDMALQGMKATHELMKSMERVRELEAKLAAPVVVQPPVTTAGAPVTATPVQVAVEATAQNPPPAAVPYPKVKCPHCETRVSTSPGPWASHMKAKHQLSGVPIPTEAT